jgi:hypothetical protein
MHLRELPNITLEELAQTVDLDYRTWSGPLHNVSPHLQEREPFLALGNREIRLSKPSTGTAVLAHFVGIPIKFYERLQPDEQQFILDSRIQHADEENITVGYREGDDGVIEVLKENQQRVPASEIVQVASRAIDPQATVVDYWSRPDSFRLDVVVPEGFDRGVGGDPQVGDITRGGVRLGQDRKNNLAPWVQPYLYRLVCTNGMEVPDAGLRVDARNNDVPTLLRLLEGEVVRAFRRVEHDIEAFYDLRSRPLPADMSGHMRRIAQENGLPARRALQLQGMLPSITEDGAPTEFDLVNLLTNQANDPSLLSQEGPRRQLQTIGGRLVNDHSVRCTACQQRLT